MRGQAHQQGVEDVSREERIEWLWMNRKDSSCAPHRSCWRPWGALEGWGSQQNTQGGHPLDEPEDTFTHSTPHKSKYVIRESPGASLDSVNIHL